MIVDHRLGAIENILQPLVITNRGHFFPYGFPLALQQAQQDGRADRGQAQPIILAWLIIGSMARIGATDRGSPLLR